MWWSLILVLVWLFFSSPLLGGADWPRGVAFAPLRDGAAFPSPPFGLLPLSSLTGGAVFPLPLLWVVLFILLFSLGGAATLPPNLGYLSAPPKGWGVRQHDKEEEEAKQHHPKGRRFDHPSTALN